MFKQISTTTPMFLGTSNSLALMITMCDQPEVEKSNVAACLLRMFLSPIADEVLTTVQRLHPCLWDQAFH